MRRTDSGSAESAEKTPAPRRRGSEASDRQIHAAVKEQRRIEVDLPSGPISGYVMGMDDYHWVIAASSGQTYLVHKSAPCLVVTSVTIAEDPDATPDLMTKVDAFRRWVLKHVYNHTLEAAAV